MSRLTDKDSYCFMSCADDYKGTESVGEDCKLYKACFERKMYDKLKHYEDLEEAGRLIETKFAIGQTVYDIRYEETYDKAWYYINKSTFTHAHIPAQDRYYATKAEAEAKLAEIQKGGA